MTLEDIKSDISARIACWAKGVKDLPPDLALSLTFSQPPAHVSADLSLPWPLQAAKILKRKPLDVAQELVQSLQGIDAVESLSAVPPGFVNFKLSPAALGNILAKIVSEPGAYGADPHKKKRSILIEFVSANPTGPLHLASGRAGSLGDSLARILKRIGHKVGTEYYVNDAGRQVELLGLSVKAWYDHIHRGEELKLPENGYLGGYVKDIAQTFGRIPAAEHWTDKDFSRHGVETMLEAHQSALREFKVDFDQWFHENELHNGGKLDQALSFLKSRNMVYEKEGAVWLGTAAPEDSEDDKDRVLVKSDKRPTYFLADIAYHKDKFDRGWEELIDILGADHHGYVPRMKFAVAALGKSPDSFHPIVHQLVHLFRGKEAVKMSKRAGEFVTLRELAAEVGLDACRFFFAMRTPNSHMNFDLELAKKQSQENPVYYVQYVHARIQSILREAKKSGIILLDLKQITAGVSALETPEERALLVKLIWFPNVLAECEAALSPHPLPTYLLELAGLFHPFYEKCRCLDSSNPTLSQARLALCDGVRAVIKEGLTLLGVSSPEQM